MIQREFDLFDLFSSKLPIFRKCFLPLHDWVADKSRGLGTYEFLELCAEVGDGVKG